MKQEWDWPPERRPPPIQGTGWASTAAKTYINWYLRAVVLVFKIIIGAACGLALFFLAVAMTGLLSN